ncbi:Uncharacterised protein [Achromobacter denitrificans]|nr:Uncharacterised protein [Achromobacter denitrificans]
MNRPASDALAASATTEPSACTRDAADVVMACPACSRTLPVASACPSSVRSRAACSVTSLRDVILPALCRLSPAARPTFSAAAIWPCAPTAISASATALMPPEAAASVPSTESLPPADRSRSPLARKVPASAMTPPALPVAPPSASHCAGASMRKSRAASMATRPVDAPLPDTRASRPAVNETSPRAATMPSRLRSAAARRLAAPPDCSCALAPVVRSPPACAFSTPAAVT